MHERPIFRRPLYAAAALVAALVSPSALRAADEPAVMLSDGYRFAEKDGEALYRAVCQSCHMAEGQGAKGAATYPALARNPRLAAAAYPVINIVRGRKGMPAFGQMLSDEQIAEVTNYVRSHFGNDYRDAVSPDAVKALRRHPTDEPEEIR